MSIEDGITKLLHSSGVLYILDIAKPNTPNDEFAKRYWVSLMFSMRGVKSGTEDKPDAQGFYEFTFNLTYGYRRRSSS